MPDVSKKAIKKKLTPHEKEVAKWNKLLAPVNAGIRAWDGENVLHILPYVEVLWKILDAIEKNNNIKCPSPEIDFDEIKAYHAFMDAGTRDDTPYPPPWDEFDTECVYVVDRSGQFLTREFGDKGAWEVQDFPKEGDCDFPKADQGTADAGLDTAVE